MIGECEFEAVSTKFVLIQHQLYTFKLRALMAKSIAQVYNYLLIITMYFIMRVIISQAELEIIMHAQII